MRNEVFLRVALRRFVTAVLIAFCFLSPAFSSDDSVPEIKAFESKDSAPEFSPRKIVFGCFDDRQPYLIRGVLKSLSGFDVEAAYLVARTMNIQAEVRYIPRRKAVEALQSGEVDALIVPLPTGDFDRLFDYSKPLTVAKIRCFVHEDTLSFIHTLKDLTGLRIGVDRGEDIQEFLKLIPGVRLIPAEDALTALEHLQKRFIHVYVGDEYEARYYIRSQDFPEIKALGGVLGLKSRVLCVRKSDKALLNRIDGALDTLASGVELEMLHQQWFGKSTPSAYLSKTSLIIFLTVFGVLAALLLAIIVWNQRLEIAVTERTQELQAEHEHLLNIFDHASDGILVIDPDTTAVQEANRAFEEITGYSVGELRSMRLGDLDTSGESGLVLKLQEVMLSSENTLFEYRLRNRIGEDVDLLIHARPFPSKGRRVVEAIVRDVTERKKIQAMKDTILQDVAHELKTPLSKMAMSIDLLERKIKKQDQPPLNKYFDICHRSTMRLKNTINGILNLSRLESEHFRMQSEVFTIQDVLKSVADELDIFAQRKGIKIKRHFVEKPLLMIGDIEMIQRLFINIVHNAIKFTDKGEVYLTLAQDADLIKVVIRDDGIGLEKEDLDKIFGRFYQKNPSYEGSGIGLTIAQKVVILHRGTIWAESAGLGKGTSMHVVFPMYVRQNQME